jgi:hypothetical protein
VNIINTTLPLDLTSNKTSQDSLLGGAKSSDKAGDKTGVKADVTKAPKMYCN